MPALPGVDEVDTDLGVLDPASSPGVLPLHPNGMGALLQITSLINHQHRAGIGQVIHDVIAQVVTDRVGIPGRTRQQMLHPIRRHLTGMRGDRPAVHPRQPRQQPQQEQPDPPARFNPREPRPDPAYQLVETTPPTIRVYAMARSHRATVLSPHNPRSSTGGCATSGTATPAHHELRLEY